MSYFALGHGRFLPVSGVRGAGVYAVGSGSRPNVQSTVPPAPR